MDKRYQVFVSSTYSDLKSERQTVMQTLMEMDCIPAGMELFPSIDTDQWEFIKKVIDDCDYYLIIVAGRYGSLAENGLSYTEKEYDYAVSKGIKVVALLHDDLGQLSVDKSDTEPEKKRKLDLFINKLKTGRLVKWWHNEDQLPGLVSVILMKTIKMYPSTGWIRGNSVVSNENLYIELEKLRKENQELREQKNNISKVNTKENKFIDINILADFDSRYTFTGKKQFGSDSVYRDWKMDDTWGNLFSAISPYCLESLGDNEIWQNINSYFSTKQSRRVKTNVYISQETLHTIKIQFMALGLISDDGLSWELTKKGKQEMIKCRVIRKNSKV